MSIRTSPPQLSFSSGEISPLLYQRSDYQRFQTGLRTCNGFLPLRQGAIARMPGTFFRGETHQNRPARLIEFVFAANDAVVLEFTENVMRVWRYGDLVEQNTEPFVLATPYDYDAVQRLSFAQSADVIYLVDGTRPVHKLSRLALDNWTIAPLVLDTGPFQDQEGDADLYITVNAFTGSITLTATQAIFEATDVGSLMQLEPESFTQIPLWEPLKSFNNGNFVRYEDKVYKLVSGENTGPNPPLHDRGIEKTADDRGGGQITYEFISEGRGVVRITAIASTTQATSTVIKRLPPQHEDTDGTIDPDTKYRFARGAWSERYGYPRAIEIYNERLSAAATPSFPRTVWFSSAGDYSDFTPGIDADDAFSFAIAGQRSQNEILWLRAGARALHIGALGEEYSTRSDTRNQVIGPTTARFGLDSTIGSAPLAPIAPDGVPMFISRDKTRLFALRYSLEDDRNQPTELSLPSEHLGQSGFRQIAWQASPLRTAWLVDGNGALASMLFDPSEDVLGWARCTLAGGQCQSIAITPDPDTNYDTMLACVFRVVDNQGRYYIEEQTHQVNLPRAPRPELFLFSALSFVLENPVTSHAVPHLAGKEVLILTAGGEFTATVEDNGNLSLPAALTKFTVGLLDDRHEIETLDVTASAADGNTLGRPKRLQSGAGIAFHRTGQAAISVIERSFGKPDKILPEEMLIPPPVTPGILNPVSGVRRLNRPGGHADETSYRIRPVGNAPLTLTAITPRVQETG